MCDDVFNTELVRHFPTGLCVFDVADGSVDVVFVNDAFYRMIGVDRDTRGRFSRTAALDAVHPDDRDGFRERLRDSIETGDTFRYRYRVETKPGSWRWLDICASHAPREDTQVPTERFYATYYDTDELVTAREGLAQSQTMLFEVLERSNVACFFYYPARPGASARYELVNRDERYKAVPMSLNDYPDSFISLFKMSDRDAASYRAMVEAMDAGEPEASCLVRLGGEDEASGWFNIRMQRLSDKGEGLPVAVGYATSADDYLIAQRRLHDERIALNTLSTTMLAASCFNVTRDTNVDLGGINAERSSAGDADAVVPYSEWVLEEAIAVDPRITRQRPETLSVLLASLEQVVDKNDRREFIQMASHFGMLDLFYSGVTEKTLEYQRYVRGHKMWVSTRLVLLQDPETSDVLAFFYTSDIDDRKKNERVIDITLRDSSDFACLIDVNTHLVEFRGMSDQIRAIAGYWEREGISPTYEDGMLRSIETLARLEDCEHLRKVTSIDYIVERLNADGHLVNTYDLIQPDGDVRRKQVAYDWFDDDHQDILAIQTDVTHAYEKERRQVEELQRAVRLAESANDAKTEFLRRISHDIRTPIGAIENLTAFAREDLEHGDRVALAHDLDRIESSNRFLLSLINDVLDISKVDAGKIELLPEPYPFDDYVTDITNLLQPMCDEKGLDCVVRIEGDDGRAASGETDATTDDGHAVSGETDAAPVIFADKVRINQVTLNLLSNAVKYTPKGGRVSFAARVRRMAGGTGASGDAAATATGAEPRVAVDLQVEDTGIGMSQKFVGHMFEEFSQEYDNPLRDKGATGTGLGLSIVKKMIDLMGGTIEVTSEVGVGTTVRVHLEFDEVEDGGGRETGGAAAGDATGDGTRPALTGHVLLAEDNEINAEIARRVLQGFGLTVERAVDGREALSTFSASETGRFGAILMDIQMPRMNGYEATRAIRALDRPDAATVPIVAMTADAFASSRDEGLSAGMSDFTTKPIDEGRLYRVLRQAFDGDA